MRVTRVAKLFKNGASQAVRLPAEFRFEGSEVFATRDSVTGDVVLSRRPGTAAWENFFAFMRGVAVPEDFMAERPLNQPPQERAHVMAAYQTSHEKFAGLFKKLAE